MYINSPGGSVYAGLGMYDTMQFVSPDIATICTGIAASMAAVLMCAGSPGKRTALKHSRIMLHQPSGGAGGQASDIEITVNEVRKLKGELYGGSNCKPHRTTNRKSCSRLQPRLLDDITRSESLWHRG